MFIRIPRSGVPHRVLRAAQRRMRLSAARCRNEMRRGKAGRSLENRTRAGGVAEIGEEIGEGKTARSGFRIAWRLSGAGSDLAIAAALAARQSWDNHSL
jgi:hypothetical protein